MIPIALSISGFLSYQEPVDIDFTTFDLACISGQNGAGKSSILDAITWALFGRARRHDESIINLRSDTAQVVFTFEYEGNVFRVTRTNPRGETKLVEFHIQQPGKEGEDPRWKPLTERTLRETDRKIEETLRLDYDTFINAAFFLQGEADQFTQQSPSARKRILSQILGLNIWETYRKRAFQKRKNVEGEIATLEGRLSEIISELEQEEQRKQHLQKLKEDLEEAAEARRAQEENLAGIQSLQAALTEQRRLVVTLTTQTEKLQEKLDQNINRLSERQAERQRFTVIIQRADQIQEQVQEWEQSRQQLTEWEAIAEEFRESEKERQGPLTAIAAEKARLKEKMESLQSQQERVSRAREEIPPLEEKRTQIREEIQETQSKLDLRGEKKQALEEARQKQAEAKAENPRLFREMKKLEKRIDNLENTEGAECPLCGQPLSPEERKQLIEELTAQGKEMGNRYRENRDHLNQADQVVKDLQLEITELSLAEDQLRQLNQESDQAGLRISQIEKQIEEWQNQGAKELKKVQDQLAEDAYALEARQELQAIDEKLKAIGYNAAEHDRIREKVQQGEDIQEEQRALERAQAALEPLEREIEDLAAQIKAQEIELEETEQELGEHRTALEKAQEDVPDEAEAERKLLALKEKENILQRELGAAEQKVQVLQKQKERRICLEERREELRGRVAQFKQLEEAFGKNGVPALLIEQALPQIEGQANQLLERLSDGSMAVRFLTQREYKDQTREDLKETLDIQIQDQAGVREYEMFSGGESFRINFAIRLALSHVLAQRAGARLQTLVIDEGFGSQDQVGRQRLIEAINLIRDDFKKILVITHIEQLKDVFTTQLLVEKTDQGSTVTLM